MYSFEERGKSGEEKGIVEVFEEKRYAYVS